MIICHKCPDIEMVDDGEWFICPCCRSRTKGRERARAEHEAAMAELGMNAEQYHEYCMQFINTDPLSERQLEQMRTFVKRSAAEWAPACEHDTNPWL